MMNDSSLFRIGTGAAAILLVFLPLTGCEFLGFNDEETVTVVDDNDDENAGNDGNAGNDENGGVFDDQVATLLDEEVEIVSDYTPPIEVDVPEDAYSISVSIIEARPSLNYMVTDWRSPSDFEIVPEGWEDNTEGQICYPGCHNRVMMSVGANGALVPNNPDSVPGIEPGTHQFRVHSSSAMHGGFLRDSTTQSAETVRVVVHAELADNEVPEGGVVDLNLFFTGANGWTADSAPDDPELANMIDEVDEMYDQVNVDIGEIAYHDVDGDYRIIEDLQSGTGDLSQMFMQSERGELQGPSVFFVEELQSAFDGMGGGVLGISGGIPGPMIVDGSPRSGVAVATDSSQQPGAGGISKVTAHELGHYFGLYHTSEQFGGFGGTPAHDPLPDTAENDESLLMHAVGTGDDMSEWQGRVMRNNPWVYQDD